MTGTEPFGELQLHRLLVAVDGSQSAELALQAAVTVAKRDHASLTLITVGPDLSSGPSVWSASLGGNLDQGAVDKELADQMDALVERIPDDIPVKKLYRRGHAGPEIVQASKEADYDAIILGARGLGSVGALLGSVSNHVLHHADVAVFVARAPKAPGPR
jgi:nucleotide-binding universal stress UspA family protein